MSTEWTWVISAPAGEAVELKQLRTWMREWRKAKKLDEKGRRWEVSNFPVTLDYQGTSKRDDLVNRIECTVSTRNETDEQELAMSFVQKVASELGWMTNDPFTPEAELELDFEPVDVRWSEQQPVKADTAAALATVKRHCAAGAWEQALDAALVAWRTSPATAIARAIDRISWRALEEFPEQPPWGEAKTFADSKTPHTLTGWLAMNLAHELPQGELKKTEPSWDGLVKRIAILKKRGRDPRSAFALCQAVLKYGLRAEASDVLEGPRRADAMLNALIAQQDPDQVQTYAEWILPRQAEHRFRDALRRLTRPLVIAEPEWDAIAPGRLKAFVAAAASRKVVADELLAQSNPLGEAIAAHTGGAKIEKRLARLLRVLLGPLHRVLTAVEYREGFPVKARLVETPGVDWEALAADDRLGTFEQLDPGKCPAAIWSRFLRSGATKSLKRAVVRDAVELEALAARPSAIAEVVFGVAPSVEVLRRLEQPQLEVPWSNGVPVAALADAMRGRAKALTWRCPPGWQTPADTVAELLANGRGFDELAVDLGDVRFTLRTSDAVITICDAAAAERLEQMAKGLPKLATLTVETPAGFDPSQLGWAKAHAERVVVR